MSESKRVLVVSAHPDDIEFGVAGSIIKWISEGWEAAYVIATRGQKGGQDASVTPEAYGEIRSAEALEAARIAGVTNVTFLNYMDSEVQYTFDLQKDIAREFRRFKPHRLITMNPEQLPESNMFINHPDHRRVARATLDVALMAGTTAMIFPELELEENLPPWQECKEIYLAGPSGGEEIVDISDTVETKLNALGAHKSQGTEHAMEFMRERLASIGQAHGYAYAEAFRVIKRR